MAAPTSVANGQVRYPDCLTAPTADNTFAGVPVSQTWNDLALWEEFLNLAQARSLVELGTWRGGMALFLKFQCQVRGMRFWTIDHQDHAVPTANPELSGCRLQFDLLSNEAVERLRSLFEDLPKPLVLYCDNGNKRQEFRSFVPLLGAGDFIAVHDWGSEFGPDDVIGPVTPFWPPTEESMTRWFQVGGEGL